MSRGNSKANWHQIFTNGNYRSLLHLDRHLPRAVQFNVLKAAPGAVLNSKNAAALAEEYAINSAMGCALKSNSRTLRRKIKVVCLEEVERAYDKYQLGAILSEIETISAELGVQLQDAKYEAWNKMEKINFSGELVGAEEKHQLDYTKLEDCQSEQEYIDVFFCNLLVGSRLEKPSGENEIGV